MAIFSHGTTTLMISLKVLLLSTAVVSLVILFNLSLPILFQFTLSDLPIIWSFIVSCLRPPYLYLFVNCIIITIVASSKFQWHRSTVVDTIVKVRPELVKAPAVKPADFAVRPENEYGYGLISGTVKVPDDLATDYVAQLKIPGDLQIDYVARPELEYDYGLNSSVAKVTESDLSGNEDARVSETDITTTMKASGEMNGRDEIVITRPSSTPVRKETAEHSVSSHIPPYSARFAHRKSVKTSPEGGKALRVSKPKRNDTLETTWKTITDGRAMSLTRHLPKSDTWDTHGRHHIPQLDNEQNQKMTKSETFNNWSSAGSNKGLSQSKSWVKLRKEPSLSQNELNRQVEAFIHKFNEEMRLQRQESLNQYMEMINRGAH